jgi:hypothetical protein
VAGAEVEHLPAVGLEVVVAQVIPFGRFGGVVPGVAVGFDRQLGFGAADGEVEDVAGGADNRSTFSEDVIPCTRPGLVAAWWTLR